MTTTNGMSRLPDEEISRRAKAIVGWVIDREIEQQGTSWWPGGENGDDERLVNDVRRIRDAAVGAQNCAFCGADIEDVPVAGSMGQFREGEVMWVTANGGTYGCPTRLAEAGVGRTVGMIHEQYRHAPRISDLDAMDAIDRVLDVEQWSPDTLDTIAAVVRLTGRAVTDDFEVAGDGGVLYDQCATCGTQLIGMEQAEPECPPCKAGR